MERARKEVNTVVDSRSTGRLRRAGLVGGRDGARRSGSGNARRNSCREKNSMILAASYGDNSES